MANLGRWMLLVGGLFIVVGLAMILAERVGFKGLPGDIVWRGKHSTVFFPIVTSIVVSIILTVLLNLIGRWK